MNQAAYGQRKSFRNNYLALAIITLLFSLSAQAQYLPRSNSYGSGDIRRYVDSTLFYPTGCGPAGLHGVDLKRSALYFDSCNHKFYFYDPKTAAWDTLHAGTVFDSTSLSNRINLKADQTKVLSDSSFLKALINTNNSNIATNTANILLKLDSVKRKSGSDSVFWYQNGISHFAYRDTSLNDVTGISFTTSGLIHQTPVNFAKSGGVWTGTQNLVTTLANHSMLVSAVNGTTPIWQTLIDSNYVSLLHTPLWYQGVNDARYPLISGSYVNPSWITSLPWSKITATPTTLAGYGITDAIQNQIAGQQASSNLWISGKAIIGSSSNHGEQFQVTGTSYLNGATTIIGTTAVTGALTSSLDGVFHSVTIGQGAYNQYTNTALGRVVLSSNVSGTNNTGGGNQALASLTSGASNTAFGEEAYTTGNGSQNVAVGDHALQFSTKSEMTAVGSLSLQNSTTGVQNTALGSFSNYFNRTGSRNTSTGYRAISGAETANDNTAFGNRAAAGIAPIEGAISSFSGTNPTTVTSTAHGRTTGDLLVISGTANYGATYSITVIDANTFTIPTAFVANETTGWWTLNSAQGSGNTAIGSGTMYGGANITSSNNTVIGFNIPFSGNTGGSNVMIGANINASAYPSYMTQNIVITDGLGNLRFRVDSIGRTSINQAAFTSTLNTLSFSTAYVSKSGAYTATISDHTIEQTQAAATVTLPTAVGIAGREYTIKNTFAGATTVAGNGAELIDGANTYSLTAQYKYVTVQSNGTKWLIISNN